MERKEIKRDPVCGMETNEADPSLMSVVNGVEYHFCSPDCQKAFKLAPGKYVSENEQAEVKNATTEDLEEMYNILSTAIEIHGRERDFFSREAGSSQRSVPKALFSELANNLSKELGDLTKRKRNIESALEDLRKMEKYKNLKVELLVTKTCMHIPILEKELNKRGIPYSIRYIEDNPELKKKYQLMGSPNIIVNGELVFRGMPSIHDLEDYLKNKV